MGDRLSRHGFNGPHDVPVGRMKEGQRPSRPSGPPCPSDPVYIIFGRLRQVVVDDMRDPVDIESSGSHVRGDQNFEIASAEAV